MAEIEAAIKTLPNEELAWFNQWYQEYLEEEWDEQIRRDIQRASSIFCLKKRSGNAELDHHADYDR